MNNKFIITSVKTVIENREQLVVFQLDKRYINYNFSTSKQYGHITYDDSWIGKHNLNLTNLELLQGSFFEPIYFNLGSTLPNGRIAQVNNQRYYIKKWKFIMNGTITEIQERNKYLLLNFETISSINLINERLLHINVKSGRNYLFIIAELRRLTGLGVGEFDMLIGSLIAPEFYEKGEISNFYNYPVNGNPGNTIVKFLNLRIENILKK